MIGERLKEYRKNKGYNIKAFANLLESSQGGLSDIENGKATPATSTLLKLVQRTDINLAWLLTGEGPMEAHGILVTGQEYVPLDDTTLKICLLISALPDNSKQSLLQILSGAKIPLQTDVQSGINEGEQAPMDPVSAEIVEQLRDMADTDRKTILETIKEKKLLRKLLKAQEDKNKEEHS
jgi:transcriptional regulator with XRE-family HTH domain